MVICPDSMLAGRSAEHASRRTPLGPDGLFDHTTSLAALQFAAICCNRQAAARIELL